MEKAIAGSVATVATMVEVTPTQLREIATLMELSGQRANPTETTIVRLTDRISFFYQPSAKVSDQIKEKFNQNPRSTLPLEGSEPIHLELKEPGFTPKMNRLIMNPQNLG